MAASPRTDLLAARCLATDEAVRQGAEVYFPHRLTVLRADEPFEMDLRAAQIGPVTVGVLRYSAEVLIETDDLETSYEINVPLTGRFVSRSGPDAVIADAGTATVYRPYGTTSFRGFGGGGALVGVKVDRGALEQQLGLLANCTVRGPLATASSIDIRRGPGRDWWTVTRALVDLLDRPEGLLTSSLVTRPLMQSVLSGLLLAVDHPYRRRLLEPTTTAAPPVVRLAVELIEDRPEEPWTVVDLAAQVGASPRTLQAGFRQHAGTTPMEYLRAVRLRRAHVDLLIADPATTSVAEVATRWGFGHLGRFASAYRAAYGTPPSHTLRTVD